MERKENIYTLTASWSGVHLITLNMGSPPGFDLKSLHAGQSCLVLLEILFIYSLPSPRWPLTAPMGLTGTSRKHYSAELSGHGCCLLTRHSWSCSTVWLFSHSWFHIRGRVCCPVIELWESVDYDFWATRQHDCKLLNSLQVVGGLNSAVCVRYTGTEYLC